MKPSYEEVRMREEWALLTGPRKFIKCPACCDECEEGTRECPQCGEDLE